jgi:hypothetical protein
MSLSHFDRRGFVIGAAAFLSGCAANSAAIPQLVPRSVILVMGSMLTIGANADPSVLNAAGMDFTNAIPAVLRKPDVRRAMFRAMTARAVTPSEYKMLGAADQGRIVLVDGYKVSAVADASRRLAIIERSCCALQEWLIVPVSPNFAEHATPAKLGTASIGSVSLGSPVALVAREFGPAGASPAGGNEVVLRYRHVRNHDCSTFYTFVVSRAKVTAISVKNAC